MPKFELPVLDQTLIKAMEKHLECGYYENADAVRAVIAAVREGKISIRCMKDDDYSLEELLDGGVEDLQVQKRMEHNLKARIRRAGVWTYVAHYWTGREWEEFYGISHNSVSGLIGYDFFGSGYELQIMEAAMAAYNAQPLDESGRAIDPYLRAS
ncbi:hypothetical protein [Neptuniibacter sp. QD37_11]|uniref:hypothetical protein n=1 Tax=Neptuniibacter sp. QD37_11 TaxID=3398209 RepID=UPI0039F623AC